MACVWQCFIIPKSSIIVGLLSIQSFELYQAEAEASSEEDHHDEEPVLRTIHAMYSGWFQ